MAKLIFITNQYSPNIVGGAEISVQTLVEELARLGHQPVVISLGNTAHDTADDVNGIRVHRLAVKNLYHPFRDHPKAASRLLWHAVDIHNPLMARAVGRILDREQPDWVSTHNLGGFSTAAWSAIQARGLKHVQVLHDYYLLCPRTTMFRNGESCTQPCLDCRAFALPKKLSSRRLDLVIGVSRFVLDRHLAHGYFESARTRVVHNGRAIHGAHTRAARAPNAPVRFGFIGRIDDSKGIELLLRAVSRLPTARCSLSIAGRPRDPAYLQSLKAKYPLSNVTYLGFVPAASFYPDVDVVVVPSQWDEPLGMAAVEPLGFGVPVIVSRCGGLPEVLEGAQDAGWLVEPGDEDALVRQMHALLDDWRSETRNRAAAVERRRYFTPERQARDYLSALGVV